MVSDERNLPMSQLRIGACALFVLLVSDSVARGQERPAANTATRRLAKRKPVRRLLFIASKIGLITARLRLRSAS